MCQNFGDDELCVEEQSSSSLLRKEKKGRDALLAPPLFSQMTSLDNTSAPHAEEEELNIIV